jgi:hypothetical protein
MNLDTLSTAELRKLEHHPDLNLRREAWKKLFSEWQRKTPDRMGGARMGPNHPLHFGIPWIGCA